MQESELDLKPIRHALILLGLMLATPLLPVINRWPWGLIFVVCVSSAVIWAVPSWRYKPDWLGWGKISRVTVLASILSILVSIAGLLLWYCLCSPNLSEIAKRIPSGNAAQMIVMGAIFACLNAVLEEIVCRGILQDALTARFGVEHGWWLQGLVFGSLHGSGVPQGWIGVFLASIYGIALGWIRQHSKGLGLCCLVHVCTDAAIFALLAATK